MNLMQVWEELNREFILIMNFQKMYYQGKIYVKKELKIQDITVYN